MGSGWLIRSIVILTSPGLTVVVRAAPWAGDGDQQRRATRATSSVNPIEDTVLDAAVATIVAYWTYVEGVKARQARRGRTAVARPVQGGARASCSF